MTLPAGTTVYQGIVAPLLRLDRARLDQTPDRLAVLAEQHHLLLLLRYHHKLLEILNL